MGWSVRFALARFPCGVRSSQRCSAESVVTTLLLLPLPAPELRWDTRHGFSVSVTIRWSSPRLHSSLSVNPAARLAPPPSPSRPIPWFVVASLAPLPHARASWRAVHRQHALCACVGRLHVAIQRSQGLVRFCGFGPHPGVADRDGHAHNFSRSASWATTGASGTAPGPQTNHLTRSRPVRALAIASLRVAALAPATYGSWSATGEAVRAGWVLPTHAP